MTDVPDDLIARARERLVEAQRRYRNRQKRGFGAITTPAMPDGLIDALAEAMAETAWDAAKTREDTR